MRSRPAQRRAGWVCAATKVRCGAGHAVQRCTINLRALFADSDGVDAWQLSCVPQDWIDMAKKETKLEDPLNDLTWHTPEGIGIKPLYTAADVEG